ncbi:MAG: LysR family transcriptional regulator [Pseudomonadota bacterium]
MKRADLEGVLPFLAVVEHGSFRAAARALGQSPSAVSQSVSGLEARLGVPLLARTTRSVGLTHAGEEFLARCRPAMAEVADAIEGARDYGGRPKGLLRLNAPRIAQGAVIEPVLPSFLAAYPEVEVETFLDDGLADIVADGFDAGIRLGQMVDPDMVSRPLTPPSRMAVVASPAYLAAHGLPETPDDLIRHRCIVFRRPTKRTLHQWRFATPDGSDRHLAVGGGPIVNDPALKLSLARTGLGLAYELRAVVQPDIDARTLVPILEGHLPEVPGFHIYFPSRAQVMLKLRVFIEHAVARLE